jgi:1,4-dihydroxy-2-naphthoate polyprenyltransferase
MHESRGDIRPGSPAAWFLAVRPLTLPASIAPVLLGWALAAYQASAPVDLGIACLAVAGLLQMAANLANDFWDARSGVDSNDRLGPRRVTQSGLLSQKQVLAAMILCMVLAAGAGLYAVGHAGWWLLLLGVVCMVAAVAYTAGPWPLARLGMGEAAALVFFGPVACTGTFAVLTGTTTQAAWWAGLVPGLHAGAIMAVNNLRDISSDERAGKRTLAVRLGEYRARRLAMGLLILGNCAVPPLAWITGNPALWAALALVPLSLPILRSMRLTPRSARLNRVLARTGQWGLLTCVVVAILLHLPAYK